LPQAVQGGTGGEGVGSGHLRVLASLPDRGGEKPGTAGAWKEVSGLSEQMEEKTVTAEQLKLRKLPRGWSGAPLGQLLESARKIVEQSEATGGSGDPRLEAALKVLEYKDSKRTGKR
jgi:hypothetical protein